MILAGLDEAALGPSLGPFCACLTRFRLSGKSIDPPDMYRILSHTVSASKRDADLIAVGDSKALYSPATGIGTLEEGVLAFLEAAGLEPSLSLADLIEVLGAPGDRETLYQVPWLADAGNLKFPWPAKRAGALKKNLEEAGIEVLRPSLRFVPAFAFNREITEGGGKGGALRSIITPLLKTALETDTGEEAHITVDRQGGRRYYGEWLSEIIPGAALRAFEENPKRSAYQVGNRSIEFLVKADALRMETALASMISKYIRESAMRLFNAWWAGRVPGIRPTAGYPRDAKRFLTDLEIAGALPEEKDLLIRRL